MESTDQTPPTGYDGRMNVIGRRISGVLIGLATAIVILTVAIVPFLSPQWVAFEQGRANATGWTGYTTDELRTATDAILSDLVFGGEFTVRIGGRPVLADRELAHMADVRTVFRGLWLLAAASLVVLAVASRRSDRGGTWRAVRRGALGLAVGVVVVGVVGLVAFDQLFELFHRVFFPAGSYLFDPSTDRLVQLFPFQFWDETSLVVGVVMIAIALAVALLTGSRGERAAALRPASVPSGVPESRS